MEIVGTSKGPDLEKVTAQAVQALKAAQRPLGRDIAKVARRAILGDVRRKRRGGLGFSGMNTRLGARTDVKPGTVLTVTIAAKPAGPWAIVEHGSKPHVIKASRDKGGLFVAGQFYEQVDHPGTTGHMYWAQSEAALDIAVRPVIDDQMADIFEEAMG